MRVSAKYQRGSRDDDYVTDASEEDIQQLVNNIKERFYDLAPYFQPDKIIPSNPQELPLISYAVKVPALLGHTSKSGQQEHIIKLEFHFHSSLPKAERVESEILIFADRVQAEIATIPYQIAFKAMTLISPPVGIPISRMTQVPKHIYDLEAVFDECNDAEVWNEISFALKETLSKENMQYSTNITMEDFVQQVKNRLGVWDVDLNPQKWDLVGGFKSQIAERVSKRMWMLKIERLEYALKCAVDKKAGLAFYQKAKTKEKEINCSAPKEMFAEIKSLWEDAFTTELPKEFNRYKSFPDILWWKYLNLKIEQTNTN